MNSHFDMSDAEGQQLDYCKLCGTAVDELCNDDVCVECKEAIAADSGEGTDMDPDKLMEPTEPFVLADWNTRLNLLLDEASDLQLKAARYAIERAQAKRIEMAKETIRQLDPKAPRPRARRSDADKPRAPKAVKNP